tara:strand:- start:2636 stop:3769 length:1134 start_codon:yes stop_codon:yes gene_type:complete
MARALILLCLLLTTTACVAGARSSFGPEDRLSAAPMGVVAPGHQPYRFYLDDPAQVEVFEARLHAGMPIGPDGHRDLVALSGGGSNGAFAAGLMTGWTASGTRPDMEVVTGVSTGALAASFVFLGPDWDDELTEAYTGGAASQLLQSQGLGAFFGSGIYKGEPLRALIDHYIDDRVLRAVAAEAATGRMLLVATTDLDSQRGVVWDMGAIARQGGPEALALFRLVLVASASVPGAFPPVLIPSEGGGHHFEEMHVDGGVATPFLALPETFWSFEDDRGELRGGRIHVIVNGRTGAGFKITRDSLGTVLSRSLDIMMRTSIASTLAGNRAFAERNGLEFHYAALPDDSAADPLDFSIEAMQGVYDVGRAGGRDGSIWR